MKDLSQKTHNMSTTSVSTGKCERGCCEYSNRLLKCSCGFRCTLPDSYYPRQAPSFSEIDRHIQDVLAFHLGVTYSHEEKR